VLTFGVWLLLVIFEFIKINLRMKSLRGIYIGGTANALNTPPGEYGRKVKT